MKEQFAEIREKLLAVPMRRRMMHPQVSQAMFVAKSKIVTVCPYTLFEQSIMEKGKLPSSLKLSVAEDILATMDKIEAEWAKKYPRGEAA